MNIAKVTIFIMLLIGTRCWSAAGIEVQGYPQQFGQEDEEDYFSNDEAARWQAKMELRDKLISEGVALFARFVRESLQDHMNTAEMAKGSPLSEDEQEAEEDVFMRTFFTAERTRDLKNEFYNNLSGFHLSEDDKRAIWRGVQAGGWGHGYRGLVN